MSVFEREMYSLIVDKPLVCQREITRSLVFALCRRRRLSVPALRTALAFGGAVFRRCGRLLGVSSRLQPLRGLCLRTACARASSRFAASNGQRSGRECIFTFRTDPQFSMVVPLRSQARLWLSLLHWAYYGLFPPLAAAFVRPCASLARCSVPAHFVCSALQPFGPSSFRKRLLYKKCQK